MSHAELYGGPHDGTRVNAPAEANAINFQGAIYFRFKELPQNVFFYAGTEGSYGKEAVS